MRKITREYLKNIEGKGFNKIGKIEKQLYIINGLWLEQIWVGCNSIKKGNYIIGITHSIKNVQNMRFLSEGISIFVTDQHWESYKKKDNYGLLYNADAWIKIINGV